MLHFSENGSEHCYFRPSLVWSEWENGDLLAFSYGCFSVGMSKFAIFWAILGNIEGLRQQFWQLLELQIFVIFCLKIAYEL